MFDKDLSEIYANLEQAFKELESSEIWKDAVMKHYRLTEQTFKSAIEEFKATCMVAAEDQNVNGLMRYFSHWYPRNKERITKVNVGPKRI